ncbi:LysM peptidoglycan-binding domain-containing protein [Arthrobacter koreensis]|uniref:LysM peptidoglycan-binding domain-containing protein n=1 Tax=Arthrobacter koreensis TaxID=199136 RepID=UPI0036DB0B71
MASNTTIRNNAEAAMAAHKARRRRTLEDAFLASAAAVSGALMLWAGLTLRGPAPGPGGGFRSTTDLQAAAGLIAGWAGLLVLAWWTVGLGAAFLSAALLRAGNFRSARFIGRLSPGFLKRLAAAALGVQLAVAPLPALAAPPVQVTSTAAPSSGASSPAADPAWQLEGEAARPPAALDRSVPSGPADSNRTNAAVNPAWKPSPGPVPGSLLMPGETRMPAQIGGTVTVTAGDTLWDLAAARLGPLATDLEIARYWPAWHEKNRSVIGPDPHRLLPGQILVVPSPATY